MARQLPKLRGQVPTDPLILVLRPWISVPGEPPTCVSVTPHTTSSVLVQWQVRAWGPTGSRKHHVREAAVVTRDSAGLEPRETQPQPLICPPAPPFSPSQLQSQTGSRRPLTIIALGRRVPWGSPGSRGAQPSTGARISIGCPIKGEHEPWEPLQVPSHKGLFPCGFRQRQLQPGVQGLEARGWWAGAASGSCRARPLPGSLRALGSPDRAVSLTACHPGHIPWAHSRTAGGG